MELTAPELDELLYDPDPIVMKKAVDALLQEAFTELRTRCICKIPHSAFQEKVWNVVIRISHGPYWYEGKPVEWSPLAEEMLMYAEDKYNAMALKSKKHS